MARADEAMVGVKKSVRTTFNQGVLGDVGNFGGLFTLNHLGITTTWWHWIIAFN